METAARASFGAGWERRVVEGKFPLLEWLGGSGNCGSFFTVLQGMQQAVIQLVLASGGEAEAYLAQWNFATGLSHPHLQKVFAAGRCTIDGSELVYVVSERSSATLAEKISSRPLAADEAREIFEPILDALLYLHENGAVHGHVKPSSIQLSGVTARLAATELLIAPVKKNIPARDKYDAPELPQGTITPAADTWSVGMTMREAMTTAAESSDDDSKSLPNPFREIVQDCLRVDPLRRSSLRAIKDRLAEIDAALPAAGTIAIPESGDVPAATPNPVSESADLTDEDANEAGSEAVLFSKSLTHFEQSPLTRFRVLPYAVVLLAVIAFVSFLVIRKHKPTPTETTQKEPASPVSPVSPVLPEEPASTAPVAGDTAPQAAPPASKAPQDGATPDETQSAPPSSPPAPRPAPAGGQAKSVNRSILSADRTRSGETTKGLVAKRVLPPISPGARHGLRRPVKVLIRVSVNQKGQVSDASYVSPGPGNYFARLAQKAAKSWRFDPPIRNGGAERSVWTLRFNFGSERTEVTATEEAE